MFSRLLETSFVHQLDLDASSSYKNSNFVPYPGRTSCVRSSFRASFASENFRFRSINDEEGKIEIEIAKSIEIVRRDFLL